MPKAQRKIPLHLQVAGYYKEQILSGSLSSGERVPAVRDLASEWGTGLNTAQRAVELLRTWGLVKTSTQGTFVSGYRAKLGPQQRLRAMTIPGTEEVRVTAAERVRAPDYVVSHLAMDDSKGFQVIRREWVTSDDTGPFMLSVSWIPVAHLSQVPELLDLTPLPAPGSAAKLISERTGLAVTWGKCWVEARKILDDGREGPALGLPAGSPVLAQVYDWGSGESYLEYGEYIVKEGRVIESDMEP